MANKDEKEQKGQKEIRNSLLFLSEIRRNNDI